MLYDVCMVVCIINVHYVHMQVNILKLIIFQDSYLQNTQSRSQIENWMGWEWKLEMNIKHTLYMNVLYANYGMGSNKNRNEMKWTKTWQLTTGWLKKTGK